MSEEQKLIEPIPVKAGDKRVLLGGEPPKYDCRVIYEGLYQRLYKAYARNQQLEKENYAANMQHRDLIERAFVAGRSQTTWEQFKKDNGL